MHASLPPPPPLRPSNAYMAARTAAQVSVYGLLLVLVAATIYTVGALGGAW